MKQVADTVYALGSSGHNYYLVRDGDEVTLIDLGCSREWPKLVAGLETLGLTLDSVAGAVATHSHADHFGLARRAISEGVDVAVHEDEETRALGTYRGRYAVTPRELPIFNLRMWRNFYPMFLAGVMKLEHVDVVGTFTGGDRLDLPGAPVAVHTPGHTEGHTMFHCAELGVLFTGDGLATMDLLSSSTGPQLMEDRFDLDHQQAIASLDAIVDLEANLLLPGHGTPWSGTPAEAVARARR